jgi:HAD superfamily hydrolase (TIGR01509 family)
VARAGGDRRLPVEGRAGPAVTARSAIAALVFDMDGLMLDTEPIYRRAWQRTAAELGRELDDHAYEPFIGRRTEDCERELAERWGPSFPIDRFHERWPVLWREIAVAGLAQKPGLTALLDFAAGRGLAIAVATSTERALAEFTLRCGGLADRFPVMVTGDEIAAGKPAPDIYLEAARRLALPPERCVGLEDSDAGVLSASRAGMIALMVPDMKAPSAAAAGAAYRVLRSLQDAPATIAELIR